MTTKLQPDQGSYLTPSLEKAIVGDAMRSGVMSCEPDLPAATVARMMATHHIHAVVAEGIRHDPVHGGACPGASSPIWTSCAPHVRASRT